MPKSARADCHGVARLGFAGSGVVTDFRPEGVPGRARLLDNAAEDAQTNGDLREQVVRHWLWEAPLESSVGVTCSIPMPSVRSLTVNSELSGTPNLRAAIRKDSTFTRCRSHDSPACAVSRNE